MEAHLAELQARIKLLEMTNEELIAKLQKKEEILARQATMILELQKSLEKKYDILPF